MRTPRHTQKVTQDMSLRCSDYGYEEGDIFIFARIAMDNKNEFDIVEDRQKRMIGTIWKLTVDDQTSCPLFKQVSMVSQEHDMELYILLDCMIKIVGIK